MIFNLTTCVAFFIDHDPCISYEPAHPFSPELVCGVFITKAVDIWGLGCVIFGITLGIPLFNIWDDLEAQFKYTIGGFHVETSSNGKNSIVLAG